MLVLRAGCENEHERGFVGSSLCYIGGYFWIIVGGKRILYNRVISP